MKKQVRIIALLTALLLCAVMTDGCSVVYTIASDAAQNLRELESPTPLPSPDPLPSLDPVSDDATPFSEMEYESPDAEAVAARLSSLAQEVAECEDSGALVQIFTEGEAMYENYSTMETLASLHSSMDLSDSYWAEQQAQTAQGFTAVDMAYQDFYVALYHSPFREDIEAVWVPGYFDDIIWDMNWYADDTPELYERESQLISEYTQTVNTATISYGGEEMTYTDIYNLADNDAYYEALPLWYDAHAEELAALYVELVKTRQQLAQALGFDNYIDMQFEQQELDYTPQMMEDMIDDVVEYLVPVYADAIPYFVNIEADYEEYADYVQSALGEMDESLCAGFQQMRDYGLIDYEPRAYKDSGAYTVYLPGYHSPFILMSFTGDEYSVTTLVHEFGHFYDSLSTGDAFYETTDMSETYSQALELLFSNHYAGYFGEDDGYLLQYNALYDALATFAVQPYYTAVELEVYSMDPELLTVDAINEIAAREAERFGLSDPDYPDYYAYGWVCTPHIYESPFYTFSYATSASLAVQLWALSMQDEQAAVDTYHALIEREQSGEFIANAQAAGLSSPFDEGSMQRLAALFERFLIEEDWDDAAPLEAA